MKLNPFQEKAVKTTHGRILVLAGAGSGKTRVIVHRAAYLIDQGAPPSSILGLTFTNKAAEEMRTRLKGLIGLKAKEVTFCTFHSFCMMVLRKEIEKLGYTKEFSLYDEQDIQRLMKQLVREMLQHEGELPSLGPTREAIAKAANLALSDQNEKWHDGFAKDLYFQLSSSLRAYNAVSFDHLISLTIELFEKFPQTLERYQDHYPFIMIDEYQDTNPAQFKLAELIAQKHQNLCVVGDDDQSIYGWRGAELKNILGFRSDVIIKLEQNYRSNPSILKAANAVIQNNTSRHAKNLWSEKESAEPVEIFNAATDQEEAKAIVDRILFYKQKGYHWKDMAILYRSNALSRQFESSLLTASWQNEEGKWMRGIPYEVFGGLEFAERSEIKDLFS